MEDCFRNTAHKCANITKSRSRERARRPYGKCQLMSLTRNRSRRLDNGSSAPRRPVGCIAYFGATSKVRRMRGLVFVGVIVLVVGACGNTRSGTDSTGSNGEGDAAETAASSADAHVNSSVTETVATPGLAMPERCVALEEPVVLPDLLGSEDPISVDDWQNTVLVRASAFDEVAGPWMLRRVDGQRILAVNGDGEQALLYWQSNRQWATTNEDVLDPPNQVCFLDYANENGLEVRDIWQSRLLVCDVGQCWAPQMTVRGGVLEESLQEAPAATDANWQQIFRFRDTALTWASDTELLHFGPWEQDPESGAAVPPPPEATGITRVAAALAPQLFELCEATPATLFWDEGMRAGELSANAFGVFESGNNFAFLRGPEGLSIVELAGLGDSEPSCSTLAPEIRLVDATEVDLTLSPHLFQTDVLLLTEEELLGQHYSVYIP